MIASIPKAIQTHSWCLADCGVCINWFILAWCVFFNLCGRPVFWVQVESSACQFRSTSARSDVSFPSPNHTPLASTPPPKSPWGMHALQWVRQGRDMSLLRGVGWGGADSLPSATQAAWHSRGPQLSISCHKFFTLKVNILDMTVLRNVTSALVVLSRGDLCYRVVEHMTFYSPWLCCSPDQQVILIFFTFVCVCRGVCSGLWLSRCVYRRKLSLWRGLDWFGMRSESLSSTLHWARYLQGRQMRMSPGLDRRTLHRW